MGAEDSDICWKDGITFETGTGKSALSLTEEKQDNDVGVTFICNLCY